jgi:SAM-dependent methyltransferase
MSRPLAHKALIDQARRLARPALRLIHHGREHHCPICRSNLRRFVPFGLEPRDGARCPVCGALERHRMAWCFLQRRTDLCRRPGLKLLHFAPEPILEKLFRRVAGIDYLTADLCDPRAMVRMDITDIPYPDGAFDAIFCSHVLEHVPDDLAAMKELRRVLRPDGWAVLQVPITGGETFEDPSITDPAERERLFGQDDHVRIYGRDIAGRLESAGFAVAEVRPADLFEEAERRRFSVPADELLHDCRPAALPSAGPRPGDVVS